MIFFASIQKKFSRPFFSKLNISFHLLKYNENFFYPFSDRDLKLISLKTFFLYSSLSLCVFLPLMLNKDETSPLKEGGIFHLHHITGGEKKDFLKEKVVLLLFDMLSLYFIRFMLACIHIIVKFAKEK
jgi:hypothetical protein